MHGKRADGMLDISMERTGKQPTFSAEPIEAGMQDRMQHTQSLWSD